MRQVQLVPAPLGLASIEGPRRPQSVCRQGPSPKNGSGFPLALPEKNKNNNNPKGVAAKIKGHALGHPLKVDFGANLQGQSILRSQGFGLLPGTY